MTRSQVKTKAPAAMPYQSLDTLIKPYRPNLGRYEKLREHLHSHPELSLQETSTAATVASCLHSLHVYEIYEHIGSHGVAAVLRNGGDKTVLLRADMDALPVEEKTGLPFASKVTMRDADGVVKPVMHACGHDIHVTCLLAAAEWLAKMPRDMWRGTVVLVFQPNEERSDGARAMVEDGLYDKVPKPDVVLGQHVMSHRAGVIGSRPGIMLAASDSFKVTLYGRGGHASMPDKTCDPVVMAAAVVMRLQTIVSREVDPSDMAVVTVGSLQAGHTENIIADRAELRINVRTISRETREKVLAAIRRIVKAECEASGAPDPPLIESTSSFPLTMNDESVTKKLAAAFGNAFKDFDDDLPRVNGSEDFSYLGTSIGRPCSFWLIGGTDPKTFDDAKEKGRLSEDIPVNHSPFFAPVMQPTIGIGMDALTLAAMTFLDVLRT
ncbi:hypothetical protein MMC14_003946 [Varicellaria rhodocarpa]|nr:hypothetical protein [Varicellaria rhodocarpa]